MKQETTGGISFFDVIILGHLGERVSRHPPPMVPSPLGSCRLPPLSFVLSCDMREVHHLLHTAVLYVCSNRYTSMLTAHRTDRQAHPPHGDTTSRQHTHHKKGLCVPGYI